jgi:uncharacterized protein (DUF983 family)
MNNIQLLWLRFRAYLRGEICPRCKSWEVKKGHGMSGIICDNCDYEYEIRDMDMQPAAPQAYGDNTVYEDYLDDI